MRIKSNGGVSPQILVTLARSLELDRPSQTECYFPAININFTWKLKSPAAVRQPIHPAVWPVPVQLSSWANGPFESILG